MLAILEVGSPDLHILILVELLAPVHPSHGDELLDICSCASTPVVRQGL